MRSSTSPAILFAAALLGAAPATAQTLLKDFDGSTAIAWVTPLGNGLVFRADGDGLGSDAWYSDGTAAGTVPLDVNPGAASSRPYAFTEFRGRSYFVAETDTEGYEIWSTDGTAAGTEILRDFQPGTGDGLSPFYGSLTVFDGRLFFGAWSSAEGVELWTSDGTSAGTEPFADLNPGASSSDPSNFEVHGDTLFFAATTDAEGRELWATDGTPGGTYLVADIRSGPDDSDPGPLHSHQGHVYMGADDGVHGNDLWRSDGTAGGTELVGDLTPGSNWDLSPFQFLSVGDDLFFTGVIPGGWRRAWRTDGTAAGSKQIFYWTASGNLVPVDGRVLFVGQEPPCCQEGLWLYDPVADSITGVGLLGGSAARTLFAVGTSEDYAFRGAEYGATVWHGGEPWKTDGTLAGLELVADVEPGQDSSNPDYFTRGGDHVFFSVGYDELHVLPVIDFGAWVAEPLGVGCPGTGGLVPQLDWSGEASIGSTLTVELSDALPSAPTLLMLSFGTDYTDLGDGCELLLEQPVLTVPLATDATGSITLPIGLNAAHLGLYFALQYAIADPGGALGGQVSVSRALEVVVGP